MNKTKVIALAGALAFTGVACSYTSPDASEMVCVYEGGPFDGKGFEKAVEPGAGRTPINFAGTEQKVPVNVRSFDDGDGLPPVVVTVRGVRQEFRPSLTFTISTVPNADGKPMACELLEQHLRPLGATDFNDDVANSEWVHSFLIGRVAPVVRDVAPRVLQNLDPTALALNLDGTRDAAAETFSIELGKALEQQLGKRYFCAPNAPFGGTAEQCGEIAVVLPEPAMSDANRDLIARPQLARTEANNEIAVATENARKAAEVARQLTTQAESATEAADARSSIAEQEARVNEVEVQQSYQWCEYLVSLGQDCALVKAAENSNFPSIFTAEPPTPVIPVTPG